MVQRRYFKSLGILLSSIFLGGCASFFPWTKQPEPKVVVETKVIKQNIPLQPKPRGIDPKDITWHVVTQENLQPFLDGIKQETGTVVFFAISVKDYERVSLTFADIKRYIEQQKLIIVYYEEAIQAPLNATPNNTEK